MPTGNLPDLHERERRTGRRHAKNVLQVGAQADRRAGRRGPNGASRVMCGCAANGCASGTGMTMPVISRGRPGRSRRVTAGTDRSHKLTRVSGICVRSPDHDPLSLAPPSRCASTFRLPTSRRSRSGTGARKAGSCCGTATRAARTTSTRGRSARSAGAPTSSGRKRAATGDAVHVLGRAPERPAAVPRAGAVRGRRRRARRGPAGDDEHRGVRVRRARDRHAAVEVDFQRDLRRRDHPRVPARAS